MKKLILLSLMLAATPLVAQRRVDLFFDVEGVRRTGSNTTYAPGTIRFEPAFRTGGGIGGGLNFFLSDRASLEFKAAAIEGGMRVRIVGMDTVLNIDLGDAQIYPVSAVAQWHPVEKAFFRPYLGAGVVHTILKNINRKIPNTSASEIRFRDPTGLVVDGGVELSLGDKWSLLGDARYVPLETKSRATFVGTSSFTEMRVRPLIVSFGAAYHF